ncbi:MAG: PBP1A family penicillin-binding protein [Acidobacteriota bacterium]
MPLISRARRLAERYRVTLRSPVGVLCASLLAISTVAVAVTSFGLFSAWHDLPDLAGIKTIGRMDQATTVYDHHDRYAFSIARERRFEVPLTAISPAMIHAILAIEDRRFYSHPGFDLTRVAAAMVANLRQRRAAQGGSTITQQLARQTFLTPGKTIRRKLQEVLLARRIERAYPKSKILELYLNKVYFGDGLYGIEAAALGYLGKHASELSVAEAALLAGLVKSPSSDAPTVNLGRAVARRNLVLRALLDTGAIDQDTWRSSRATPVRLHDSLRSDQRHAQYFKEQVRRELLERFGAQAVIQDGLRVFSTVDMPIQAAAEAVLTDSLKTVENRRREWTRRQATAKPGTSSLDATEEPLQGALIALDPATGHIRAIVGGRDFTDSSFNRAIQARRQPGSAFKPIVYAAALEAGYTPATILEGLDDPSIEPGAWVPDDEHSTASSMSVRTALRTSSNRAAVRVLHDVGIGRAVKLAEAMGLGKLPGVPSLALGSGEVTLRSLTAAYAAFANHGMLPRPSVIRRVEDRTGRVLYDASPSSTRTMSDGTAFLMSSVLADVINTGTAARVRGLGFGLPAAGKTGTTSDFKDAWFVGYTSKLVAGVWIGFDEPRTILPNGFAAEVAVPAWANFMKLATNGDKPEWMGRPSEVTSAKICRRSGKLATAGCEHGEQSVDGPAVYTEYFARGTEPTTYCDLHGAAHLLAAVNPLSGGINGQRLLMSPTSRMSPSFRSEGRRVNNRP